LEKHPGINVIVHERAGGHAGGARPWRPHAKEVADRWYMLRNCSDYLLNVVEKQHRLVCDVDRSLTTGQH
jgi:hypothetical protein